jgi:hypothetical protein
MCFVCSKKLFLYFGKQKQHMCEKLTQTHKKMNMCVHAAFKNMRVLLLTKNFEQFDTGGKLST